MTIDAASGAGSYDSLLAASNLQTATALSKSDPATTSTKASGKTADNKDMFMKLLVAQLRYQDPSKPVDSTEFVSQTAQFSSLETMEEMNTNNTAMLAAQLRLQASTLVGQTVSYDGPTGPVSGVVSSAAFSAVSAGGTGGEPVLKVGGADVLLSKVTTIGKEAPPTT
ncbi:flagellar hook capping protein [Kineococcus sp. R8]|uniref:flagellar hook assembly protein FlgD n=1 Tax=Kineococcus siccus TaxID=2696567 RepID=UPI0014136C4F|nr:flagellar hook capping FlgD N-terminal domain-containing protein [Kineococcus siccus]NAZ84101.1 flagellar hook capping protein [Kineococcus siccus]